jgi:hypothetical protein
MGVVWSNSLPVYGSPYDNQQRIHGNQIKLQSYRYDVLDMTMSLYLFLDMYLHSGEYHVGTVGIDIRNYIFAVLMR